MAKSEGGYLDHMGFEAIKEELTASLAAAFKNKIEEMGEDAKGISWFSASANAYAAARNLRAA